MDFEEISRSNNWQRKLILNQNKMCFWKGTFSSSCWSMDYFSMNLILILVWIVLILSTLLLKIHLKIKKAIN